MDHNDASHNLEKLVQEGKSALNTKNYLQSEAIWREIIKIEPNHIDAHFYLGKVLYNLGKFEEAIINYIHAIKLAPENVDFYSNLGTTLFKLYKFEEATAAYRKALELAPENAGFYSNLGAALSRLDKFEEATAAYHKTLELDSNNINAYKDLGFLAYQQKKYKKAINIYHQGIELDNKDAQLYRLLGTALEASGQYHKAILAHFRSLQLNPKYIFKYKYFLLLIFGWFVIIAYYSTHPLDFSWFWTFVYIGIQLSLSIIPLALKKLELEIHDFLQQRASILLFLQFNHPGYRFCFFIYRFCNIVYGIIQLLLSIISLELKNLELKLYGLFLQKILFNSSLDCRAKIKIRNDFVLNKDTAISQALVNKIDRHLISTLLLLPGEDGIFRVPILLLGTNWLNATIFGIIFGFYHIENQSALLCLEISIIMTISNLVVLPHSLLACIIGHLVSDLIIIKLNNYIYESRS
jgi:tetratricopeptide (TPR) repeat protein